MIHKNKNKNNNYNILIIKNLFIIQILLKFNSYHNESYKN